MTAFNLKLWLPTLKVVCDKSTNNINKSDIIEDFKELEKNLSNVRTVADDHSLHYRLGQLDILDLILKRKETCEQVYEELSNG